jgi:hypothetical protein
VQKVAQKCGLLQNFRNFAQSKNHPMGKNTPKSGHPVRNAQVALISRAKTTKSVLLAALKFAAFV